MAMDYPYSYGRVGHDYGEREGDGLKIVSICEMR
jgi:hypothetical protein